MVLALAAAGCSHGSQPAAVAERAAARPTCGACHDADSGLRARGVALCGPCHLAAHRGEVARQMAPESPAGGVQSCTSCHDPHREHR